MDEPKKQRVTGEQVTIFQHQAREERYNEPKIHIHSSPEIRSAPDSMLSNNCFILPGQVFIETTSSI